MLPAEALAALDGLPVSEALHRPLMPEDTPLRRTASLLGGDAGGSQPVTVGDVLFRWARAEPEALADADVAEIRRMSDMVAAAGRIPKRLGFAAEARRSAAGAAESMLDAASASDAGQLLGTARSYLLQRLVTHLHQAQGCEASICGPDAGLTDIFLNGLPFAVHDPADGPPGRVDRLTLVTQDMLERAGRLTDNPLVYALSGLDAGAIDALIPGAGMVVDAVGDLFGICVYANAAAQSARVLLRRDTDTLLSLASMVSTQAAGHLGHAAGKVAAVALLGLTGSWAVVLAPVAAGFAGRVAAKTLARRARYAVFCRREVAALNDAVRLHCVASRDALSANIADADAQAGRFREMHAAASGPAQAVVADWLDRLRRIQEFRGLNASRLHRAVTDPSVLDPRGGDPVTAARESLLTCAHVGLHPANVAATTAGIVTASTALEKRMRLTLI